MGWQTTWFGIQSTQGGTYKPPCTSFSTWIWRAFCFGYWCVQFCYRCGAFTDPGWVERLIACTSFSLSPSQRNYCTTRKELLAVVRFTRQFRHHLLGKRFYVRTDHCSLTWLMRFKNISGMQARWIEELSQYDMVIIHRKGSEHINADARSRIPESLPFCNCYVAGCRPEDLPCAKDDCKFCPRVHEQWARFEAEVEDVIPLAVRQIVVPGPSTSDCDESGVMLDLCPCIRQNKLEEDSEYSGEDSGEEEDGSVQDDGPDGWFTLASVDSPQDVLPAGRLPLAPFDSAQDDGPVGRLTLTSLSVFGDNDLEVEQSHDEELRKLLDWKLNEFTPLLEGAERHPTEAELQLSSPAVKFFWTNRVLLDLKEGYLYYRWVQEHGSRLLFLVPPTLRQEALRYGHDVKMSGHPGISRTYAKLLQVVYWRGMRTDCQT